jgi:hypothetical protein
MSLWWVTLRNPDVPDNEGGLHYAQVEAVDEDAAIAEALDRGKIIDEDGNEVVTFSEVVGVVPDGESLALVLDEQETTS